MYLPFIKFLIIPIQRHLIWCRRLYVSFKFLVYFCCWEYVKVFYLMGKLYFPCDLLNKESREICDAKTVKSVGSLLETCHPRQVEHIFASTCAGHCVVWDLRKQSSIMTISDTVSRVSWHLIKCHFFAICIILFKMFSSSFLYGIPLRTSE